MFTTEPETDTRAQSTESNNQHYSITQSPNIEQLHDAWTKFKDYENSNEAFMHFIKILASDEYSPENLSDPYAWDNIAQALEESMVTTVVDFLDKHGEQCSLVLVRLAKSSAYVRKQLGGLECNMEKLLRRLNECRKSGFNNETDRNLVVLLKALFDPHENSEMIAYNQSNYKQAKPSDGIAKVDARLKELFRETFEKPGLNSTHQPSTTCSILEIFHSCLAGSRSNADFLTSSSSTPNSSRKNSVTQIINQVSPNNQVKNQESNILNSLSSNNQQFSNSSNFTNLFAQILFIADYSSSHFTKTALKPSVCEAVFHQLIKIIIFLWQRYKKTDQHTKFITDCLWPLLSKQPHIVTSIFLQNVIKELQLSQANTVLHNLMKLGYLKKCLENSAKIELLVLLNTIQLILHGASVTEIELFESDFGYENLEKILLERNKISYTICKDLLTIAVNDAGEVKFPGFILLVISCLNKIEDKIDLKMTVTDLEHIFRDESWNMQVALHMNLFDVIVQSGQAETLSCLLERFDSLTTTNLKSFVKLLGKKEANIPQLIKTLAVLARKNQQNNKSDNKTAKSYFSLSNDATAGLTSSDYKIDSSCEFTVIMYICIRPDLGERKSRRVLFSFLSSDERQGYEAFLTKHNNLVIASLSSDMAEYRIRIIPSPDIFDGKWHSLCFTFHRHGNFLRKVPCLTVIIDESVKLKNLPFPDSGLTHFQVCSIGGSSARLNGDNNFQDSVEHEYEEYDPFHGYGGNHHELKTINMGMDVEIWGNKVTLNGYLGQVYMMKIPITLENLPKYLEFGQKNSLFENDSVLSKERTNVVFHYHPRAVNNGTEVVDLSYEASCKAHLQGSVINSIHFGNILDASGGVQLLLPVIEKLSNFVDEEEERVDQETLRARMRSGSMTPKRLRSASSMYSPNQSPRGSFDNGSQNLVDSYEFVDAAPMTPIKSTTDFVDENVAACLINILTQINSNTLYQDNIITIGLLFESLPPTLIDERMLLAVQMLREKLINDQTKQEKENTKNFNDQVIQKITDATTECLCFNFNIWSRSSRIEPRIGHIQYLTTLIKDDVDLFHANYGIPYFLKILRNFCGGNGITDLDTQMLRVSVINLIDFYARYCSGIEDQLSTILSFLTFPTAEQVVLKKDEDSLLLQPNWANREYEDRTLFDPKYLVFKDLTKMLKKLCDDKHKIADAVGEQIDIVLGILSEQIARTRDALEKSDPADTVLPIIELISTVLYKSSPRISQNCKTLISKVLGGMCVGFEDTNQHLGSISQVIIECLASFILEFELENCVLHVLKLSRSCETTVKRNILKELRKTSLFNGKFLKSSMKNMTFIIIELVTLSRQERDIQFMTENVLPVISEMVTIDNIRPLISSASRVRGDAFEYCALLSILQTGLKFTTEQIMKHKNYSKQLLEVIIHVVRCSSQAIREVGGIQFENVGSDLAEAINNYLISIFDNMISLLTSIEGFNNLPDETNDLPLTKFSYGFLIACLYSDTLSNLAGCKLHHFIETFSYPKNFISTCLDQFLRDSLDEDSDKNTDCSNSSQNDGDSQSSQNTITTDSNTDSKLDYKTDQKTVIQKDAFIFVTPVIKSLLKINSSNAEFLETIMPDLLTDPEWIKLTNQECKELDLELFMSECLQDDSLQELNKTQNQNLAESRYQYMEHVSKLFSEAVDAEQSSISRYEKARKNQQLSMRRQWRAIKRFLLGPRGLWSENDKFDESIAEDIKRSMHWKMSPVENQSRMRLKLIQNLSFNSHRDASRLRDNLALEEDTSATQEDTLNAIEELHKYVQQETTRPSEEADEGNIELQQDPLIASQKRYTCKTRMVSLNESIEGRLEISATHVFFFDTLNEGFSRSFKWSLTQLREMHFRRRNLRKTGIEFFWIDHTSYLFSFEDSKVRNNVYNKISSSSACINLLYKGAQDPHKILSQSGLTEKWVNREISNFQYIMHLNTIAGRTYNDLSQYPIFPWIIADYHRKTFDVEDPTFFRDLSKPMGVQNPKNVERVEECFETSGSMVGSMHGSFHYGTHYSNPGSVMSYLVRIEPFTSLHIELQAGKFDVADRLFHNLAGTWETLMEGGNDVRELIPEFFYGQFRIM